MAGNLFDNKLWAGHRVILSEMREKAVNTCGECCFLVEIQGREEIRWGCVVGLKKYGNLEKRVPRRIDAREIIKLVGAAGLMKLVEHHHPGAQALWVISGKTNE